MASVIYNNAKKLLMNGGLDLDTDTIKVALVTSTYVPNIDTHTMFSDVTNEVVGTGYTAGGATLATATVVADNTGNTGVFDAADTTWTTSTITARGAVIYKSTGTASTSPLLAYVDFVTDKISTAGTFTIAWNASGIITLA
ncbi:hypothetical protein HGB25_00330 [Candidatus Saccharibacteria bacterium]|nr:hypothetical protein [Candidatus Saccharibacteria bacterium]